MRSSSTPGATEGIGLDKGIECFAPFCKSKITLPISRRASSGKLLKTALAFGWKRAGFTESNVSDMGHPVKFLSMREMWLTCAGTTSYEAEAELMSRCFVSLSKHYG